MSVIAVGDLHGEFHRFNALVQRIKPDLVLQCGDYGYWPEAEWYEVPKCTGSQVLWIDGNHEDHDSLAARDSDDLSDNVTYMPRGSTHELPDGRVCLFLGGAASIDKPMRQPGYDWFEAENLTCAEVEAIPDMDVDVIVSHTCPNEFYMQGCPGLIREFGQPNASSRAALSMALKRFRPKRWVFGHWHRYSEGLHEGCKWTALNEIGNLHQCWREV